MKCPKCDGEMEEGQVTIAKGGVSWVSNHEDKNFLTTISTPAGGNITANKCKNCGYLESYAK